MSEKKIFLRRTHLGSQILFHFGILFLITKSIFIHFRSFFIIFSLQNRFLSLFISFFILFSVISTKLTHFNYLLHISLPFCVDTKLYYTLFFHLWILLVWLHFFRSCLVSNCLWPFVPRIAIHIWFGDTNVSCFSGFVQACMIVHFIIIMWK